MAIGKWKWKKKNYILSFITIRQKQFVLELHACGNDVRNIVILYVGVIAFVVRTIWIFTLCIHYSIHLEHEIIFIFSFFFFFVSRDWTCTMYIANRSNQFLFWRNKYNRRAVAFHQTIIIGYHFDSIDQSFGEREKKTIEWLPYFRYVSRCQFSIFVVSKLCLMMFVTHNICLRWINKFKFRGENIECSA